MKRHMISLVSCTLLILIVACQNSNALPDENKATSSIMTSVESSIPSNTDLDPFLNPTSSTSPSSTDLALEQNSIQTDISTAVEESTGLTSSIQEVDTTADHLGAMSLGFAQFRNQKAGVISYHASDQKIEMQFRAEGRIPRESALAMIINGRPMPIRLKESDDWVYMLKHIYPKEFEDYDLHRFGVELAPFEAKKDDVLPITGLAIADPDYPITRENQYQIGNSLHMLGSSWNLKLETDLKPEIKRTPLGDASIKSIESKPLTATEQSVLDGNSGKSYMSMKLTVDGQDHQELFVFQRGDMIPVQIECFADVEQADVSAVLFVNEYPLFFDGIPALDFSLTRSQKQLITIEIPTKAWPELTKLTGVIAPRTTNYDVVTDLSTSQFSERFVFFDSESAPADLGLPHVGASNP